MLRSSAPGQTRILLCIHNNITHSVIGAKSARMKEVPILMNYLFPLADKVIAVSKGVRDDVPQLAGLPESRVMTIYNPIFQPSLLEQASTDPGHPWLAEVDRIPVNLGVGKLRPQKDFETLIKAFALLTQRRPARLIILGEGEELDRLNACARELGVSYAVDLPGYVLNPYAYLSQASIFVLSSAWEGLGNVIVEALACGCPVVSTDCPSGPREILDGGRFGKLVPVRDAKAIADAIEETLDNPPLRDSLRKRAQDFNVADSVSAYETEMLIKTRTLMS